MLAMPDSRSMRERGADMRQHILEVAERIFYSEGTRSVGIDRIIAEADIAKATLYRHFATKDDLIRAYLTARHDRIIADLAFALAPGSGTPRERILRLYELLRQKANQDGFRGCAFLIAVAENENSPPILEIARTHKLAIRDLIRRCVDELSGGTEALCDMLALSYEGALAMIAVQRSPDPARMASNCVEILIDQAEHEST